VLKELAAFHATGLHFINTYPGGREALALEYPDMFTENFVLGKDAGEEMMYRCQFHQHSTYSFCARRSQKHKKYSQVISVFLRFWDLQA